MDVIDLPKSTIVSISLGLLVAVLFTFIAISLTLENGFRPVGENAIAPEETALHLSLMPMSSSPWTNMNPTVSPPVRSDSAMASVYGAQKIVLFGGLGNTTLFPPPLLGDTWVYDYQTNTWKNMSTNESPPARAYSEMVTVYGSDKVVLFGGVHFIGTVIMAMNDTWVYNLNNNTWTNMNPKGPPPARGYSAMASIFGTDRVVLFGGSTGFGFPQDTWVYDLNNNTWANVTPSDQPAPRYGSAMTTIYGTDKVVLFGGMGFSSILQDTWIYNLNNNMWTNMTPLSPPSLRYAHVMASIYGTDKALLFGGTSASSSSVNDTWVYDLDNNTWTNMTTTVSPMAWAWSVMASVYGTDKVVLFSGDNNYLPDTWVYDLSASPSPIPETPLSPFPLIILSVIIFTAMVAELKKR